MKTILGFVFFIIVQILFIGWVSGQNKDPHNTDQLNPPNRKVLINPPGTEIVYHTWEYSQAVRVGDTIRVRIGISSSG